MQNRIDLFTLVHKGIRWWLGTVSAALGATDFSSRDSAAALEAVTDVLAGLDAHGHHEDTYILPIVRRHAADRAAAWLSEHRVLERAEAELRDAIARLAELGPSHGDARSAGLALYRAFNRFCAETLQHLDREETELMPLLWRVCSDAELAGVMTSFKADCGTEATAFHQRNAAAYTPPERDLLGV